jgi:hypothetical protein
MINSGCHLLRKVLNRKTYLLQLYNGGRDANNTIKVTALRIKRKTVEFQPTYF